MIELYTAATPNGWKISIMLEECGLDYRAHPIALGKGEQRSPEFLAISPNGRIPAIVDTEPEGGGDPVSVFETAAILVYLGDKTGQFLPSDLRGRTETLEWLVWQVANLGPMLGQHGHFALYATEKLPYAIERYRGETLRLYGVMDRRLEQRFESREDVVIRVPSTGKVFTASGCDVGRHGMRLETEGFLQPSMDIEVAFPNTPDQVHCYGRIVWGKPRPGGKAYDYGVAIEAWHGIVRGENSWTRYKGVKPKQERRTRPR